MNQSVGPRMWRMRPRDIRRSATAMVDTTSWATAHAKTCLPDCVHSIAIVSWTGRGGFPSRSAFDFGVVSDTVSRFRKKSTTCEREESWIHRLQIPTRVAFSLSSFDCQAYTGVFLTWGLRGELHPFGQSAAYHRALGRVSTAHRRSKHGQEVFPPSRCRAQWFSLPGRFLCVGRRKWGTWFPERTTVCRVGAKHSRPHLAAMRDAHGRHARQVCVTRECACPFLLHCLHQPQRQHRQ